MVRKRILLVDHDTDLVNSLAEQLQLHEEFDPSVVHTAAKGLEMVKDQYFDAFLLDVGLPDMDGRDLCRLMRRNGVKSPIIILTGRASEADIILGLESGADDYVTKPFTLGVLMARLRAQLRQHELSEDAVFAIGPYRFQPAQKVLLDEHENQIRLTDLEVAILKNLYRTGKSVVGREKLLLEIWGYNAEVNKRHDDRVDDTGNTFWHFLCRPKKTNGQFDLRRPRDQDVPTQPSSDRSNTTPSGSRYLSSAFRPGGPGALPI